MSIKLKVINEHVVTKIPQYGVAEDNRPIRGVDLFPEIYSNIFCLARKNSGKSTTIFKIIKECITRETKVILFVSTLYKDSNWIAIRHFLQKHKIEHECHTSLKENGMDKLNELVTGLELEAKLAEEQKLLNKNKPKEKNIILCESDEDDEEKPKKSKYRAPEYLIILDDLSSELKTKSLVALLKKNRHFKSKVIVSSQYLNDLLPEARLQLDVFLVFGNQTEEKLQQVYKDSDSVIPFATFKKIYYFATSEKFSFLYVNTRTLEYRKNFNTLIDIKDIEK